MFVGFYVVPMPACKVGNLHRSIVVVHRKGTELSKAAPFCKVVHVDVEGKPVLQTVNQTGVHNKVHAAVSADLFGIVAVFFQDRVIVFVY